MTIKHKKESLLSLVGIFTHSEAEELRKHIKEIRLDSRKRLNLIAKRLE